MRSAIKATVFGIILLLQTGCLLNPGLFGPDPERGVCHSADNYFFGRMTFSPNLIGTWDYVLRKEDESVSFHHFSGNLSTMIMVLSYSGSNKDIDFDDIEAIREDEESHDVIIGHAVRRYQPEFEVEILTVGELQCVRSFDLSHAPIPVPQYQTPFSGGVDESVLYLCPVPSQKGWMPIHVSVSQSTGRGTAGFDMDEIAQGIIRTIKLNPNPPEHPDAVPSRTFPSWTADKLDFLRRCREGKLWAQDPDYICPDE